MLLSLLFNKLLYYKMNLGSIDPKLVITAGDWLLFFTG
jgi:hypothetical protein